MDFSNGKALAKRAHKVIPGGCHTYAKGDDQYPELAPSFIVRGSGCHVWDADGNEFIEYGMGLRAVTLGHAYAPVVEAAHMQMLLGNNYTRPAPVELEYAEALLSVVPGADMVKFAKDGSSVTTAAIKLARAYTNRTHIAYCKSHPFFSYNDWFIGTTQIRGGVPKAATEMSLGFEYNDIESLRSIFEAHPDQIACVIMEPERDIPPEEGFLQSVRQLCDERGALLIFDEMITGFRWAIGGAQSTFGVTPDLSTFGKAIGNGFALSALLGKKPVMELGGLDHDKERVFLLSTTHGAENHALAAALATLDVYKSEDVIGHLERQGIALQSQINSISSDLGLQDHIWVIGKPCNLVFTTRGPDGKPSQAFRTLLLQELIRYGILAPSLVASFSHDDADIEKTVEAFAKSMAVYRNALDGDIHEFLVGPPIKTVYRARN